MSLGERLNRSYQLVRDLDAGDFGNFEPIGDCGPTGNCMRALGRYGFAGVFDGQGHRLKNLTVNHPERGGVGLFGVLAETGVIMNLHVEDIRVPVVPGRAALWAPTSGSSSELGEWRNRGRMAVGGVVGGSSGLVYASHSTGKVIGSQATGGLVGDMTGAVFFGRSSADVSGQRGLGGLVGLNTFGYVLGSHAAGTVTGVNDVGGLVGVNTDARVRNSHATGAVEATGNNVGGLVGFNSLSMVRNSYAANSVRGAEAVGGLVGRNNGAVASAYATGPVDASGQSGAVTGFLADGTETGIYPNAQVSVEELLRLNGDETGWAPSETPARKLAGLFLRREWQRVHRPR